MTSPAVAAIRAAQQKQAVSDLALLLLVIDDREDRDARSA